MATYHVTIDQSDVYAMVNTFEDNLYNAELFAAKKIEDRIRFDVFGSVVHRLGARAGEGFPRVYRDHLSSFMRINIPIIATATGGGIMRIEFDLSSLGDWTDLELGAHHQALIYEEPGATYGTTKTGRAKYNMHPAKVQLPYQGEPLMSEQERRQEFWEEAIVGQQTFITNLRRGKGYLEISDAPTFEEVAAARVFEAWVPAGVAPEWLWLEYGFNESEPRIPPMDFTRTIENVSQCIAESIYYDALIKLVQLSEAAGGAIGVGKAGRVYERATGRFVSEPDIADTQNCLGSI